MPVSVRNLQIFTKVVECGNMHQASKELYIAQPAVSKAICDLEKQYNVKLFERFNHKLHITPSGVELLSYAKQILALNSKMEFSMHNCSEEANLRIGATIMAGTCLIIPLINEFEHTYPKSNISVRVGNANVLKKRLLDSEIDFALAECGLSDSNLISESVIDDQMILICSVNHPFAKRKCVTLEEISKEYFIGREEGQQQEEFENLMNQNNYPLRIRWISNNSETTKRAVVENYAITVISKRIVLDELNEGKLVEVPIKNYSIHRKVRLVYHKSKYISDPLGKMFDLCRRLPEIVA